MTTTLPATPQADKPKFLRGMFLWLQQIATDRALPPMALHVATALASHVNQRTGDAWPWQETLANALSITTRAVQRNVAELIARGHLGVTGPRGRYMPNRYRPILKGRTAEPGGTTRASGLATSIPDAGVVPPVRKTRRARRPNPTLASSRHDARVALDPTPASSPIKRTIEGTIDRTIAGTIERASARESDQPNNLFGDECDRRSKRKIDRAVVGRGQNGSAARGQDQPEGFAEFYRVYPRHAAKGAADKAYRRIVANGEATPGELLAGAMRYAAERTGEDERFTKHPATWLNGQCWKDAPAPPAVRPRTNAERLMEQCGLVGRGSDNEETEFE